MLRYYSQWIAFMLAVAGPGSAVAGPQATEFPETSRCIPPAGSGYTPIGLGFLHPLPSNEPIICQQCRSLPQEAKDHIYIFLVNGVDPLYSANLNGLCAYLHSLGFAHTEAVRMISAFTLRDRILDIRASDLKARFVLLGYSAGANCVRSLAQGFNGDNLTIDLMIYLGRVTPLDTEYSRLGNGCRIVNITGGWIVTGEIYGARNEHVPVGHYALPSSARTIEILVEELVSLSGCTPAAPVRAPMAKQNGE
jgi:hypothetical protein